MQLREVGRELSEQIEQVNELAQARVAELEQELVEKQKEIDSLYSNLSAVKLSHVQSH